MTITPVATGIEYQIPLLPEVYDKMQEVDDDATTIAECFFSKVMKLKNVYKVDYNGHFGYNLFISVEQPEPPDIWNRISELLTQHTSR